MHTLKKRSGYTLIEVLLVMGIMGFIGVGAVTVMMASVKWFDVTSTETFTDTDAVIAMQMIVSDIREAKSINIIANGERLRTIFPKRTEQGYYDRHEPDMANQIDYYISDSTGVPGHSGTWLWKGKSNNTRQPLKKGVTSVLFEQDTSRSVKITIRVRNNSSDGPRETVLTQRVVYLRNY